MTRLVIVVLLALGFASPADAQTRLTVLLDWFVNPDHGPLVVAQQKGWFKEAGLDVELIAPADPNDPPKLVAAKQADIAVSYQPQLHLQVNEGLPLVRVGTLIATPLNSLVFLKDGPIDRVSDLKGKKVGFSVGGFEEALLGRMLAQVGLGLKDVELVNINFSLTPALVSGQVHAVIGAFRNFELNQLDLLARPGKALYPEEEGVPPYDELIFVVHKDSVGRAELRRFLDIVERAALWITNRPEQAWEVFAGSSKELDDALNKRAWAATVPRFAHSPAALDSGRYVRFARFLEEQGLIKNPPPVEAYAVDLGAKPQPPSR